MLKALTTEVAKLVAAGAAAVVLGIGGIMLADDSDDLTCGELLDYRGGIISNETLPTEDRKGLLLKSEPAAMACYRDLQNDFGYIEPSNGARDEQ